MMECLDYIGLFRSNDERGLSHIYDRWFKTLYYIAFKIVKDEDVSQDIAQESFIKIWNQQDKSFFVNDLVVIKWLRTTTTFASLNYVKRQDKTTSIEGMDFRGSNSTIEDEIIKKERIAGVTKFLKYLPTECRRIMDFLFIEGLSIRIIANNLGLAISTVKNQRIRGLGIIKDIISGKRLPVTKEEASEFSKLVIPEELTKEYLMENLEVIKLIVPKMNTLYKKIIKLYIENDKEGLRKHNTSRRKSDGREYSSSIFYRTKKRAFDELKRRLSFEKEVGGPTTEQVESIIRLFKSMRDTDKIIVSRIINGSSPDDISKETFLSLRTIRNAGKEICIKIVKIYPHPSLLLFNRPSCLKLKDFLKFHKTTIGKQLKKQKCLEISSRKKYTKKLTLYEAEVNR